MAFAIFAGIGSIDPWTRGMFAVSVMRVAMKLNFGAAGILLFRRPKSANGLHHPSSSRFGCAAFMLQFEY